MTKQPQIERLDVSVYRVPTDAPEADGTLAWDATEMLLVEAHADGVTGTGWTYGAAAGRQIIDDLLAGQVVGGSAHDIPAAHEAMARRVRNAGRPGVAATAISAVDCALWDLKARLLGVSLSVLLGRVHEEVPVYGSGGFVSYDDEQLRSQLTHWVVEERIPRVKIKIGERRGTRVDRDLDRMAHARQTIGTDVELYVDANGGYSRKQAIRVAEAARDLNLAWYEEPVSSDDIDGLREVRDRVLPDVAAGEYGWDVFHLRRLCESGAVDCLQADASRCGGITGFLRAGAIAAAHNLELSAHCAPHLHAHVMAALPNARHIEWFHDHVRIEGMFFDGCLDPHDGAVRPDPDAPGHGLGLRREKADSYRAG